MSNFSRYIKHPVTGKKVLASFLDNHFGNRQYGVVIVGSKDTDKIYKEDEIELYEECN